MQLYDIAAVQYGFAPVQYESAMVQRGSAAVQNESVAVQNGCACNYMILHRCNMVLHRRTLSLRYGCEGWLSCKESLLHSSGALGRCARLPLGGTLLGYYAALPPRRSAA